MKLTNDLINAYATASVNIEYNLAFRLLLELGKQVTERFHYYVSIITFALRQFD